MIEIQPRTEPARRQLAIIQFQTATRPTPSVPDTPLAPLVPRPEGEPKVEPDPDRPVDSEP